MIVTQQETIEKERRGEATAAEPKAVRQPIKSTAVAGVSALQRAAGNRAVEGLLYSGTGGDSAGAGGVPSIVAEVLGSGRGDPLDQATRESMESRFGEDFSQVRVHTTAEASESAEAVNALAYTVGNDVVFGTGQYTPRSPGGEGLLVHELGHVMQQSNVLQRKPAKSATEVTQQETTPDDFAEAQGYINSYYLVKTNLVTDLYLSANNAVHQFGIYSTIADHKGSEIPLATMKAVLALIPGAAEYLEVIEMLEKGTGISQEIAGLAVESKKGPDARETTAEALQKAISPYTKQKQVILESQQRDIDYLSNLHRDPKYQGRLLREITGRLGPTPKYDAEILHLFGLEYELQLYREYYVQNASIGHYPLSMIGNPHTSYRIFGVTEAAQERILTLHKRLGHTVKVSIDPRYSPSHAEVVKILLDWGVKLYWMPGKSLFVKDEPESLHTGEDLRQPYKGEKHKEVDALP
jgi:hypothetical protein